MKNKPYPKYDIEYRKNLRDFISSSVKLNRAKPAFMYGTNVKTYEEFESDIKHLGTFLIEKCGTKAKIALIGANSYEWVLSYFAIACTNNIVVPIDKELDSASIEGILNEVRCDLIICTSTYKEVSRNTEKIIIDEDIEKCISEGKLKYEKENSIYENISIDSDDTVAIIYTSGTTGIAKGVELTHRNLCADVCRGLRYLLVDGSSVLVLPLHHTFAFTANILCTLNDGYFVKINQSLKRVTKDMQEVKPEFMFLVPMIVETFYKKIWSTARENKKEKILRCLIKVSNTLLKIGIDVRRKLFKSVLQSFGGNLRVIICGGALLDPKYVKGFRDFGVEILNGYGITECSPIVAVSRNCYHRDGSVGLALDGIDVKIDCKDGQKEGEILVKGDIVMKGYFNNIEKTKEAFTDDGYFKTGDIGYFDDDGFLFITGRIKNIIILDNGKNVYPEELELVLLEDEGINEVVVKEKDKKIIAEIFPNVEYINNNSELDVQHYLNNVIDMYNKGVPAYRQINDIVLRNSEFPKTTTKKIKR